MRPRPTGAPVPVSVPVSIRVPFLVPVPLLVLVPVLAVSLVAAGGCRAVGGAGTEFGGENSPPHAVTPREAARRQISTRSVRDHLGFLASDDRRGRDSVEGGLERSAAWIADQLYRAGIEPAGEPGGFLQYRPEAGNAAAGAAREAERGANVVGRLPGSNLARADEWVVVMAPYGEDDDAAGVAALVEVARAFGALPRPPARPVLFLAVSDGERGRLGSAWFARNPTEPIGAAVAVLELDVIGRGHADSLRVLGSGDPSLPPLIARIASATPELQLAVTPRPGPATDVSPESDPHPFARLGIPIARFVSASQEDQQAPSDEPAPIDADKITRVARLVFLAAHRLAEAGIGTDRSK